MRTLVLSLLLLTVAYGQQPPKAEVKPPPPPAIPKVEDAIRNALRTHPDIKVAEAKRQMADAELEQAKLLVSQRISAGYARVEQAKRSLELEEEYCTRIKASGTQSEAISALAQLHRLRTEFIAAESELKAAVGTTPQAGVAPASNDVAIAAAIRNLQDSEALAERTRDELGRLEAANKQQSDTIPAQQIENLRAALKRADANVAFAKVLLESVRAGAASSVFVGDRSDASVAAALAFLARSQGHPLLALRPAPVGAAVDKLKVLLDKPLKLELVQADLDEAMTALFKAAGEPNFVVRLPKLGKDYIKSPPNSTVSGELSFTAALQFIMDDINGSTGGNVPESLQGKYELYVREYGLLVARSQDAPKDATTLTEFAAQVRAEKAAKK